MKKVCTVSENWNNENSKRYHDLITVICDDRWRDILENKIDAKSIIGKVSELNEKK